MQPEQIREDCKELIEFVVRLSSKVLKYFAQSYSIRSGYVTVIMMGTGLQETVTFKTTKWFSVWSKWAIDLQIAQCF